MADPAVEAGEEGNDAAMTSTWTLHVALKELPDAMDSAVYVAEKFPLVVDPTGQATRFLKYQRGTMLMAANPADMAPESLRRHLVGALKYGSLLIINFDTLVTLELEQFFAQGSFPREVFSRQQLFSPPVLETLLRPAEGDPGVDEFIVNDHFKLVVLCRAEEPPPATAKDMCVIHVHLPSEDGHAASQGVADQSASVDAGSADLAKALGVSKEKKRNSVELVEAAFDNEMDTVMSCLDKNFDIESEDGHAHTALSEAACQGHNDVVQLLLERGADPNKCNDENRSPLYRAAYNGHIMTLQLLLESGGDPRLRSKQGETAYDVAKSEEVQAFLAQWDIAKTDKLMEERRKVIEAKWQERITTHVEREQFALMTIHSELLAAARDGKLEDVEKQLEQLADEALETGDRPRASADIRDEKGSTLLALAAQSDHVELVVMLVSKGKALQQQAKEMAATGGSGIQQQAAERTAMLARVWKVNVNSRDCRGWTPVAIAVFHEAKKSLRVLLDNGADPSLKNQYNKNAYYFAKDDLDAANNIVKSRAEIRQVLVDWENEQRPAPVIPVAPPDESLSKPGKPSPKKLASKGTKKSSSSVTAAAPTKTAKTAASSGAAPKKAAPAKKPTPKTSKASK